MESESATRPGWSVPAGAPLRVSQWLIPPLILVALGAFEAYVASTEGSGLAATFAVVVAVLLVASAVALWIFGHQAYRDLNQRAVDRYAAVAVISLLVAAVALSRGLLAPLPLAGAGYLLAGLQWTPARRARAVWTTPVWWRVSVAAAVVAVVCSLLVPLAVGLGSIPLIMLVTACRIIAPFVFGFSLRLRRPSPASTKPE